MTELLYGSELNWGKEVKDWTRIEWPRLVIFKSIEDWIEQHCNGKVWCRAGSFGWNMAFYFEDPNEAILFKLVWG